MCAGPGHTEMKISAGDAYLIELGARLPAYPMVDAWIAHSDLDPHRQALACWARCRGSRLRR